MLIRKFNHDNNMIFKTKFTEMFLCFILVPKVGPLEFTCEICRCFGSGHHFRAKNNHHQSPQRILVAGLVGDENARDLMPDVSVRVNAKPDLGRIRLVLSVFGRQQLKSETSRLCWRIFPLSKEYHFETVS